jgi:hypothetical protein
VLSCLGGGIGLAECAPVWQLLAIVLLIAAGIVLLLVMRVRALAQSRQR